MEIHASTRLWWSVGDHGAVVGWSSQQRHAQCDALPYSAWWHTLLLPFLLHVHFSVFWLVCSGELHARTRTPLLTRSHRIHPPAHAARINLAGRERCWRPIRTTPPAPRHWMTCIRGQRQYLRLSIVRRRSQQPERPQHHRHTDIRTGAHHAPGTTAPPQLPQLQHRHPRSICQAC